MDQTEARLWLIEKLKNENPVYRKVSVPDDEVKQKELLRDLQAITSAIDQVPDADCRILLRYKYIEGIKDWDAIADRMNFSPDYIKRGIHSKALRLFIIPQ